jgi:hypothetical protein
MQQWSEDGWGTSVSSRCWGFTPYDGGWVECAELRTDTELRGIVDEETRLDPVPDWAAKVVEISIAKIPFCGSYHFPRAFIEVVDAIGTEKPPDFNHGCFTVDENRKHTLADYCLALDAWLAGATPEDAAASVSAVSRREIEWDAVCIDLWHILGERTEVKRLLVRRLLHYLNWCLRTTLWDDDRANRFALNIYFGPQTGNEANQYAHPDRPAPGWNESASPRVIEMEKLLAELCPDWDRFRTILLEEWWLCAPKAFRFLERKLWFIGKGSVPDSTGFEDSTWTPAWWEAFLAADVPPFLRAEDTYPDQNSTSAWWSAFCDALDAWLGGEQPHGEIAIDVYRRLGPPNDVKRWLVRLYRHRTRVLQRNGEQFARLVSSQDTETPHA